MHMSTLTNYETALFSNLITHPGCQSFKKIIQVGTHTYLLYRKILFSLLFLTTYLEIYNSFLT